MKQYKITARGLVELEEKLNQFFEDHPQLDIRSIRPSRHINSDDFVKGDTRKKVTLSIEYEESF